MTTPLTERVNDILRACGWELETLPSGLVLPNLTAAPAKVEGHDPDGHRWMNTEWRSLVGALSLAVGGAWIAPDGEVEDYEPAELLGGHVLDADWFRTLSFALSNDAYKAECEAESIVRRLQLAGVREVKRVLAAAPKPVTLSAGEHGATLHRNSRGL